LRDEARNFLDQKKGYFFKISPLIGQLQSKEKDKGGEVGTSKLPYGNFC
jgi:hypothetical protein